MGTRESHGRELRGRLVGGIQIAEVAVPAGLRLARHAHSSGQLVCVLAGNYAETWRRGELRLRPGSVLFRPPGEEHENAFDRDGVLALVISYPRERVSALGASRPPAELPTLPLLLRHQVRLELDRDDPAACHALEGLALILLSRVERAQQCEAPAWLPDALAYIQQHFHQPISLTSVAGALGLHRALLAAAFRRHCGRSVGQAIRDARLCRAIDRIRSSNLPLSELAIECGFFDQAHLGRVTKRVTGHTPGEIRAAAIRPPGG